MDTDYPDECYQNFALQCQCYDWCYGPIFYPSSSACFATNCCEQFSPDELECIAIAEEDVSLCKTGNERTKVSGANNAGGCADSGGKKTRRKEKRAKESKTRKATGAGGKKPGHDSKIADSSGNNGAKSEHENLQNAAESNEKNNGESSEVSNKVSFSLCKKCQTKLNFISHETK